MRGYTCATCGGNLSPYGAGVLFNCNFCGKLYAEDKEITHIEASRDLRLRREFDAAEWLMQDHIARKGESCISLRELLLIDLKAPTICGYIKTHLNDPEKVDGLVTNKLYRRLRRLAGEESGVFFEQIDSLRYDYDKIEKRQEKLGMTHAAKKFNDTWDFGKRGYVRKVSDALPTAMVVFVVLGYLGIFLSYDLNILPFKALFNICLAGAAGAFIYVRSREKREARKKDEEHRRQCQKLESSIDAIKKELWESADALEKKELELFAGEGEEE